MVVGIRKSGFAGGTFLVNESGIDGGCIMCGTFGGRESLGGS